jgi:hypothetical protein
VQEQPFVVTMPGREATDGEVPDAVAWLLAVHGRHQVRRRHGSRRSSRAHRHAQSERQLRIIDHDQDGSMELKKREGYF